MGVKLYKCETHISSHKGWSLTSAASTLQQSGHCAFTCHKSLSLWVITCPRYVQGHFSPIIKWFVLDKEAHNSYPKRLGKIQQLNLCLLTKYVRFFRSSIAGSNVLMYSNIHCVIILNILKALIILVFRSTFF